MTILIVGLILVLVIIGLFSFHKRVSKGCCESSDDPSISKKKIDSNQSDYPFTAKVHVEGMHCKNCVDRVTEAYAEKDCLAVVSLKKKEAVVHMKRKLSDEMLAAIPSRIGYDAWVEK